MKLKKNEMQIIVTSIIGFVIGCIISLLWLSLSEALLVFIIMNLGYFARYFVEKLDE